MSLIVNVHEAKTHFSRLLEQAHAGQEIIVAKAGRPYARLVPLAPGKGQRQP
ncbi:MAG: type II toxin-antitoxin system prevent-host-death family antitoxin, partial [Planctomycetota bacterium]|nr:type II toxin-antitoxin system prevent-host-death family antitoxin [Planctomycetota bacterium]